MGFKCNDDSSQIMNIINSESDDDSEEAEHSYITMKIPEQIENESMPIEEELPTESPAKSHQPSEYLCTTQAIQVSEATSTGDERKTESVKEVTLVAKTEALPTFPPEVLNNEEPFLNTEGVDHEELSPTLFWDDTEVDKEIEEEEKEQEQEREEEKEEEREEEKEEEREEEKEEEREEEKEEERVEQARQQETVPSIVCTMTVEGWVNVHTNLNDPATIQEEEDEDGFNVISFVPIRVKEEDGFIVYH